MFPESLNKSISESTQHQLAASHTRVDMRTLLAIADQNSNFMDEIWNYLSWHCVYFDFKHALIGFCVWGTSEVINYHSLSALVKATAAFHRGLAGSFVYKEGDRNRPLRVMCFSQTAISSERKGTIDEAPGWLTFTCLSLEIHCALLVSRPEPCVWPIPLHWRLHTYYTKRLELKLHVPGKKLASSPADDPCRGREHCSCIAA